MLGQIAQINRHDLALNLPNNLTGYVPLTSISDELTQKLQALAVDDEGAGEQESDKNVDLQSMFSIGQYLRAYVTSTENEESNGSKGKRHIELSINPRVANGGLKKDDFLVNSTVQASVQSVQDHGLIMSLGLEDQNVRGFMPLKELGPNVDGSTIAKGTVYMCLMIGKNPNGNTIKLSPDPQKIKGKCLTEAPTVDSFLPGTAVDVLISEVTATGIAGKVIGLLNVTADLVHSGAAASGKDLEKKYSTGSKIRGRIICTFPTVEEKKLGISLQDHILSWKPKHMTSTNVMEHILPTQKLSISSIIEQATVVKIEQGAGLFVDVGVKGVRGFVHISKVSDGKVETLSESTGPYKLGSAHKARIIGYNAMDGLFIVSMESKVINQPFLRIEDVKVGQIVKGTIEKLMVDANGISGILVNIADGITGLVPEVHFADVHLQQPEKKFKVGNAVTARVLSTIPEKRQIRMTLKKTLVNSDVEPWTSYHDLKPGLHAPGTIIKVLPDGAKVQFYGPVRAFLPVAEMSESYVQDPKQHFRTGQVVNVHIVSVKPDEERMTVSCKDPSAFGAVKQEALSNLKLGSEAVGSVTEKTNDEIVVELESSGLKASLPIEHLKDGSAQECIFAAKRIRVGQELKDLVVLGKHEAKRLITLTSKPSLREAAKKGTLLKTFEDVQERVEVRGFVRNVRENEVFVQFAGELTALLRKQHLPKESLQLPEFGLRRNQSITARVLSVEHGQRRFFLTQLPLEPETKTSKEIEAIDSYDKELSNPIDGVSASTTDFTLGKLTKAKIMSVKETQLNIQLADGVQGRIDVSEVFDKWEEINDRKHPLKKYHTKQILPVRILGVHDSRNHRFLPITHRGKAPVFELTAKPSNQGTADLDILTIDKVDVGSSWLVFVNKVTDDYVWVNLSPNVRGRVRAMDVSDDVSALKDLPKNFPVGSVLRARVLKVDVENNHLDLSARSGTSSNPSTLGDLSAGMVLPARVTKVSERQVIVQLNESLSGPIYLVDLADDYDKADPTVYQKNQTLRVCVKHVDIPNKRVTLTARPSKVLSSSLPVKDPDVNSINELKVNDVRRGFIKNVAEKGIFVSLSSSITAFVRVSDLSDAFLKDWQAGFEIDQLVEGKIISVDPAQNHVQMSLKRSHLDSDYKPPLLFSDIRVGQIVTGKVRKVAEFGVFIVVDDSANVSGLCHRTKMADQAGANPQKLYEEGDAVKAKVLHINKAEKKISFGLKASYFESKTEGDQGITNGLRDSDVDEIEDDEDIDGMDGVELDQASDSSEDDASGVEVDIDNVADMDSDLEMDGTIDGGVQVSHASEPDRPSINGRQGLSTGGFDWTGGMDDQAPQSETDTESIAPKPKKKKRRPQIQVDRTGDLDAHGLQSIADFERHLMTESHKSHIWIAYMAFQLQLSEIPAARAIAERALATIPLSEQDAKLDIWMALLNLENLYGSPETVDAVFKRACQYNDSLEIHSRLASIYIQSSNYAAADTLFQAALKKFKQNESLYLNYATFLFTEHASPDRARALLPRAMQSLPKESHRDLTFKFAKLEFKTPHGDPERGRTIFETLLSQWPKKTDYWDVLLTYEKKSGDKEVVRRLYERLTGGSAKLKVNKAQKYFKEWWEWEEKAGDKKGEERVKALAAEYVRKQGKDVELP